MRKIILLLFVCSLAVTVFAQESKVGKKIWAKSVLGKKAPGLTVEKWLTEKPDVDGKFVLIDFWGPSCAPRRKGIPDLNRWSKQFKDDLVVIGITSNKEEDVRAMKEPVIEYYSGIDSKNTMAKELEVRGYPHLILIDQHGIVHWEGFPFTAGHELTAEVIDGLIKKYGPKRPMAKVLLLNQKAPELNVEKWLTEKPDTKGKFVLIDFWGPSCCPCVAKIPELNEWSKRYKDDLVVIGLAPNPEERVRAMKEPVIEYYSAIDTRKERLGTQLGIQVNPYILLIDPSGVVRWEGCPTVKGNELTAEMVEDIIKKYK